MDYRNIKGHTGDALFNLPLENNPYPPEGSTNKGRPGIPAYTGCCCVWCVCVGAPMPMQGHTWAAQGIAGAGWVRVPNTGLKP